MRISARFALRTLAGALQRGGAADGAAIIPLKLSSGKDAAKSTAAGLIWPIPRPTLAVGSGTVQAAAEAKPSAAANAQASRGDDAETGRSGQAVEAKAGRPRPRLAPLHPQPSKSPCRWSSPWRRSGKRWGGSPSLGRARSSSSTSRARRCSICRWAIIALPAARRSRSATSSASASPQSPAPGTLLQRWQGKSQGVGGEGGQSHFRGDVPYYCGRLPSRGENWDSPRLARGSPSGYTGGGIPTFGSREP